jgi:hypothetical protein
MTPPEHFALINKSAHFTFADMQKIAASVNAQLAEDFYPIWQRHIDITAYETEADVPVGHWKSFVQDGLAEPGALGYHTDELNQPVSYIDGSSGDINQVCVTVSHETIEAGVDPYGNRLITALHPINNTDTVRILCEPGDPSEAQSYERAGLQVSDFYVPEWFDPSKQEGVKYSYLDKLPGPRTIIDGGYMSFIGADGKWYQLTNFDGLGTKQEGPFDWQLKDGQSLREMVDEYTRPRLPKK